MKTKLILLILCCVVIISFIACNKNENIEREKKHYEIDFSPKYSNADYDYEDVSMGFVSHIQEYEKYEESVLEAELIVTAKIKNLELEMHEDLYTSFFWAEIMTVHKGSEEYKPGDEVLIQLYGTTELIFRGERLLYPNDVVLLNLSKGNDPVYDGLDYFHVHSTNCGIVSVTNYNGVNYVLACDVFGYMDDVPYMVEDKMLRENIKTDYLEKTKIAKGALVRYDFIYEYDDFIYYLEGVK